MAGIIEGPLSKWTNVVNGWQYRWFVLDDNAGLLSYYTVRKSNLSFELLLKFDWPNLWFSQSKDKMTRGERRGCIRLKGAIVGIDDEDDTTFTVTVDMKVFHVQAKDPEEREQWIRALEDTILRHAQLIKVNNHLKIDNWLILKICIHYDNVIFFLNLALWS